MVGHYYAMIVMNYIHFPYQWEVKTLGHTLLVTAITFYAIWNNILRVYMFSSSLYTFKYLSFMITTDW